MSEATKKVKAAKAPKEKVLTSVDGWYSSYHKKLTSMPPSVGKKVLDRVTKKELNRTQDDAAVHEILDKAIASYTHKKVSSKARAAAKKQATLPELEHTLSVMDFGDEKKEE